MPSTKATAPARLERSLQSDHLVDGVRPTLVSADIVAGGTDLTLRWDKALDEDSVTGSSLFNVQTTYLTYLQIAAISIQGKVVTLTLSSAVSATDQLTVFYNERFGHVPEDSLMEINHRALRDTVGNAPVKTSAVISITRNPNSPPEFPTAEDGARSVDENTPAGRNIGDPIRATDADSSRLTYSISGPDTSSFDVVASSGQLRTKAALDYESRDSYSFTMSVHDGRDVHGYVDTTVDDTISVTVTVEDVDEPPEISGAPTISGTAEVGETLTADTSGISDIDGLANATFTYQWLADEADISGATGSTHTLVAADEGKAIRVRVSFTDDRGNQETLTSAATPAVEARPNSTATGEPTISGTLQVRETLSASTSGIADTDGLANVSYSYQWIRNDGSADTDIQDTTGSSYTLVDADEGKTIKVQVDLHRRCRPRGDPDQRRDCGGGGPPQLDGHGRTDDQRDLAGKGNAECKHLGHCGHRRVGQRFLQLPVDKERW